jgi:methylmalonyl-CoA mutase N-terminal domain/subunit
MLAAIEAGYVQREIERAAYDYQKAIEVQQPKSSSGSTASKSRKQPRSRPFESIRPARRHRSRDSAKSVPAATPPPPSRPIERVGEAARNGANLMPPILAAVEAYATIGEIADALRAVFGEYSEVG